MSEQNNAQEAQTETTPEAPVLDGWRSRIPAAHKDKGFWNNVKSEEDLYNQFAELQRYRGQSIKIPGETATNEDWNSLYAKLGRPDSADDYNVTMRDHDGKISWAEGSENWVKNTAHKLGLNNNQVQTLVDSYADLIVDSHTQAVQARDAKMAELRDQFGDSYERRMTLGERAMQKVGGEEFIQAAKDQGWIADPTFAKTMLKLGSQYEEAGWVDGRVGSMTRGDAQAKLSAIMSDMGHAYWSGHHPGHNDALKEVQALEDIVYSK